MNIKRFFQEEGRGKDLEVIEIRPCRDDDFNSVIHLLRELWTDKSIEPALLRPVFDRALISDSKVYLCATQGEQVIGFASLTLKDSFWPEGRLAYIDELVVSGEHRNKGAGARLIARMLDEARQKGCCRIELPESSGRLSPNLIPSRNMPKGNGGEVCLAEEVGMGAEVTAVDDRRQAANAPDGAGERPYRRRWE